MLSCLGLSLPMQFFLISALLEKWHYMSGPGTRKQELFRCLSSYDGGTGSDFWEEMSVPPPMAFPLFQPSLSKAWQQRRLRASGT